MQVVRRANDSGKEELEEEDMETELLQYFHNCCSHTIQKFQQDYTYTISKKKSVCERATFTDHDELAESLLDLCQPLTVHQVGIIFTINTHEDDCFIS